MMSGVDEAVLAQDGARLWATRVGAGAPVADLDAVRRHFGLNRMALMGHSERLPLRGRRLPGQP